VLIIAVHFLVWLANYQLVADTTPPDIIGSPSVSVSTRKATITWTTDRTSDSRIQYGTQSGKYQATESAISDQVKVHQVELTGLEAGTTYFYKTKWTDGGRQYRHK
jgi:phosphodiesterase/alkaline phosphatase D-like protein